MKFLRTIATLPILIVVPVLLCITGGFVFVRFITHGVVIILADFTTTLLDFVNPFQTNITEGQK